MCGRHERREQRRDAEEECRARSTSISMPRARTSTSTCFSDSPRAGRYSAAAATWRRWLAQRVLAPNLLRRCRARGYHLVHATVFFRHGARAPVHVTNADGTPKPGSEGVVYDDW